MVRVVGKEGALGAGGGGNCSSGHDGSRRQCGDMQVVQVFTTLTEFDIRWGVRAGESAEKKRGGAGGEGEGFQEVWVTYNIKIHSSFKIKDLVDSDLRNIVCDPPIARINHV